MRIRAFILCGSASLLAAGLSVVACGGSEATSKPGDDAGAQSADSGNQPAADGSTDAGGDPGTCDTSKDFLADIPDASLADGASTTGACIGCLKTNCENVIQSCQVDCECRGFVGDVLDCYAKEQADFQGCAIQVGLSKGTPSQKVMGIAMTMVACARTSCGSECAVDQVFPEDGGSDSGTHDAGGDAEADAAH